MRALLLLALASCATSEPCVNGEAADCAPVDWSDGKSDASGVPATFDHNNIISNAVMTTAAVDASAVQAFLEHTPYHTRSWLADLEVDNVSFATLVVDVGTQYGVDPIVLLARMQVESSLVSATVTPSHGRVAAALGCACPDGSTCGAVGLVNQLQCAGQVFARHFAESQNHAAGEWRAGATMTTSDHIRVTPIDDATAAMYAYTPWVLPNSGGNWLVWNVTRRYLKAFDAAGTLQLP